MGNPLLYPKIYRHPKQYLHGEISSENFQILSLGTKEKQPSRFTLCEKMIQFHHTRQVSRLERRRLVLNSGSTIIKHEDSTRWHWQ
jgi:hypothetical protein